MSLSSELRAALLAGDCNAVDGDALTGFCDALASVLSPRFGTPRTKRQNVSASSGAVVLDPNDGTHIVLTLTGSVTSITMLSLDLEADEGSTIKLEIIQGGAGGWTVGSWVGFGFVGGVVPVLVATAGYCNIITAVVRNGLAAFMGQRPGAGFPIP